MRLADCFRGVAAKRIKLVELGNQQEFNGINPLKKLLGTEKAYYQTKFIYFADDKQVITDEVECSWYDSRENKPRSAEYRYYYQLNKVIDEAEVDDLVLFCVKHDGTVLVVVGPKGSTSENQLQWLFDIQVAPNKTSLSIGPAYRMESEIGFAGRYLLEELGIEISPEADETHLERMLSMFGGSFPTTAIFSEFARSTMESVNPLDGPDEALMAWFEQEEKLFRVYEDFIVSERLESGFDDVDSFVKYSLSVLNRRKSRAGHALENHLESVLEGCGLKFSTQCQTEGRKRPDFVFPGCKEYKDTGFADDRLLMLGVKSTCKDRWRQVLSEAQRISEKHLLTLEPGISIHQTDEMVSSNLRLVIPSPIHDSYTNDQQGWLMSLSDFIEVVQTR